MLNIMRGNSQIIKNRPFSVVTKSEMTNTHHNKLERNNGMFKFNLVQGKKEYFYQQLHSFTYIDKTTQINKSQLFNNNNNNSKSPIAKNHRSN